MQHRRADESAGRVKQLRIMLIPPALTLAIFPIENIKSPNASQSHFLHRHSSQSIDYVVQERRNHRAESGKESASKLPDKFDDRMIELIQSKFRAQVNRFENQK